MRRALVTYASGSYAELLEIARPSFQAFCDRHGYDLIVAEFDEEPRPPSWMKIPALSEILTSGYDEALFVGSDIVIVDPSDDLDVPGEAWQALVAHHTGDGEVPNADFWLVRKPMLPWLERIWRMTGYTNHGWWEQAALVELMGYRGRPLHRAVASDLYERTHFLDLAWNVHRHDMRQPERRRVMHATMWPDRAQIMREWAAPVEVAV